MIPRREAFGCSARSANISLVPPFGPGGNIVVYILGFMFGFLHPPRLVGIQQFGERHCAAKANVGCNLEIEAGGPRAKASSPTPCRVWASRNR